MDTSLSLNDGRRCKTKKNGGDKLETQQEEPDAETEKSCEETYQQNNRPQNTKIKLCRINVNYSSKKANPSKKSFYAISMPSRCHLSMPTLSLLSQVWKVNVRRRDPKKTETKGGVFKET